MTDDLRGTGDDCREKSPFSYQVAGSYETNDSTEFTTDFEDFQEGLSKAIDYLSPLQGQPDHNLEHSYLRID